MNYPVYLVVFHEVWDYGEYLKLVGVFENHDAAVQAGNDFKRAWIEDLENYAYQFADTEVSDYEIREAELNRALSIDDTVELGGYAE